MPIVPIPRAVAEQIAWGVGGASAPDANVT